jgi:hypothetical protein
MRLAQAGRNPPIASIGTMPYTACEVTAYYRPWCCTHESDARPICGTVEASALGTCVLPSAGHLGRSYFTAQAPYWTEKRSTAPGSTPYLCGCLWAADSTEFPRPCPGRRPPSHGRAIVLEGRRQRPCNKGRNHPRRPGRSRCHVLKQTEGNISCRYWSATTMSTRLSGC